MELVDELPQCDVEHRGLLLDLGGSPALGSFGGKSTVPDSVVASSHDGASWARIYDRKLSLDFFWPDRGPLFVSLRALGRDAASVVVAIDGQTLGTLKLVHDEIEIQSTGTTELPFDAGLHQLQLQFRGASSGGADPFAEVDWVRIGIPDELKRTYGAPTELDVLTPAAELGGVPHRALALRAPGAIRCALRVPIGARVRMAVGIRGAGSATVAIRVRQDGEQPVVLQTVEVKGGPTAQWTDVEAPLEAFESKIVALELVALKDSGTGRLMLGDPKLVVPAPQPVVTPPARTVVWAVLDGVERAELPPWRGTPTPHLPALTKLARTATIFDQHRSPSTLVAATMASLLTGASPRLHQLADPSSRLPAAATTLAAMARGASVRAAMFTGVPTTFRPFGFGEGWDQFQEYPPNGGHLASAPLDDALVWLGDSPGPEAESRPMLAVVHARGGHPPWELTPAEANTLPPADYTGYLGPRRAGQILAEARERRAKLSDADVARMTALYYAGLSRQDQALGKLVEKLEENGRWDSTLFVVMGDVSSGLSTLFADGLELDEQLLATPLLVHFPGGQRAGDHVAWPTDAYDVARTTLLALGITPPADMPGRDLGAVAAGQDADGGLRVAYVDDRYSARWGQFALHGQLDAPPRLCALEVDPTCSFDRKPLYPIVTQAMFRRLVALERRSPVALTREAVTIDSEMAAMLKVWGAY
jgi:arylsulfatase A-like enzyme